MPTLPPNRAAELASGVYAVLDNDLLTRFLKSTKDIFSLGMVIEGKTGAQLISTSSAFAVCAVGTNQYKNDLFIIFRGTTGQGYGADIITDLRIGIRTTNGGHLVHSGFAHCFESMQGKVSRFISSHSHCRTIHVIGHSLGGAVANLAADWASRNTTKEVKLYTFGSPRVSFGNIGFASSLTNRLGRNNIFRVYHGTDPVTMIPVFPYWHAPTNSNGLYLPFGGVVMNLSAHKMLNYIRSVARCQNWQRFPLPPSISVSKTSIRQWLDSDIPSSARDSSVWEKLNYALSYVVQAVIGTVQIGAVAGLTIADQIAMVFHKGIKKGAEIAAWILSIMRRVMRLLGMKIVKTAEELSASLMRLVLNRLTGKLAQTVKRAIESSF